MENLNPLYRYLALNTPLIIGDRSISTYGRRVLKGMRSFHSQWPLPGVYLPTEIAHKILQKHSRLKARANDMALFSFIASIRSEQRIEEIFDDYVQAKNLRKLVNYTQAAQLITQGEISEKSQGVLYTLLLFQKYSLEHNKSVHDFDALEEAYELVASEDLNFEFHVAEEVKNFALIGFREFYPAEQKLISLLEKKYYRINLTEEIRAQDKSTPQKIAEIHECPHILWASDLKMPGPLEAQLLSGSDKAIRLSVSSDIRYYAPALDKIKASWPRENTWLTEAAKQLKDQDGREQEHLLLTRLMEDKTLSGVNILESLSFFKNSALGIENLERPLPLSKNPSDPLLLSLEDIPLIDPSRTALWAKPEKLSELVSDFCASLNPLKAYKDLEKHLAAEGIAFPRVEEEQKNFEKYFYGFVPNFKILKQKESRTWEQSAPYQVKAKELSKRLSPSGLETLNKCSLLFHYSREERIEQFEGEDSLDISPLRRGNWIHYTLEKLPWSKPQKITRELIHKTLLQELPRAFDAKASDNYLALVKAQANAMSEALYHYVIAIDIPLYENFPARKSQPEIDVNSTWGAIPLRGRVDRLDFVGDGALLWDYKTGNYSSTLDTHFKNGKFQWLLYREIFRKEGTPIHGGGYINPLDLKKSRLFFFKEAPLKESFYESLDTHNVPYELISAADEERIQHNLKIKIDELIVTWQSGLRTGKPRDESDCNHCAYVGRCGYPYGVSP